jgi:hypothetical protein
MWHCFGGPRDAFSFDEHFAGSQQVPAFDIEQMRRVQHDRLRVNGWQERRQHD